MFRPMLSSPTGPLLGSVLAHPLATAPQYIASIYEGTKNVDGEENLATNVDALRIRNVVDSGTITLYIDDALLGVFDTTEGYTELVFDDAVIAAGTEVSWEMSGVTQFDLGQGVVR